MLQRENIELYLKGCESFGLKAQDLFQVNDLYENKNLYMVVDNLYCLGGMVMIKIWTLFYYKRMTTVSNLFQGPEEWLQRASHWSQGNISLLSALLRLPGIQSSFLFAGCHREQARIRRWRVEGRPVRDRAPVRFKQGSQPGWHDSLWNWKTDQTWRYFIRVKTCRYLFLSTLRL